MTSAYAPRAAGDLLTTGSVDVVHRSVQRMSPGGLDPQARLQLFRPFERGRSREGAQGLGLGLFIAAEIAKGHGGRLTVDSDAEQTRFTLRIPAASPAH